MFGWLADLLVKSSVVGSSCPCRQGQNEQLKKMQKAVLDGALSVDGQSDECTCGCEQCQCEKEKTIYAYEDIQSDMKVTYHYKI